MHGSTLPGNLWWWILKQFLPQHSDVLKTRGCEPGGGVRVWGQCPLTLKERGAQDLSFRGHRVIWGRSDYFFQLHPKAQEEWSRIDSQQVPALCCLWEVEILSIVSLSNNKELIMKINRCDSPLHESLPPLAIILSLWRRHREPFSGTRSGGWQDLGPQGTGHLALSGLRSPLPFILYKQFFPLIFFWLWN